MFEKRLSTSRVMVVEDDPNMRSILKDAIESKRQLELVGCASTRAGGLALLRSQRPNVILVDLGLPDGSGLDIIREAASENDTTHILVISVFGEERQVVEAVKAGAGGYLLKDDHVTDIAGAVCQLTEGGAPVSPRIARYLLRFFKSGIGEDVPAHAAHLTKTEKSILQLVSKGYTAKEIAEMNSSSYFTITTHIRNIYKKLAITTRAEAVMEAYKYGLVSDHIQ